jgi:hypothetical protein
MPVLFRQALLTTLFAFSPITAAGAEPAPSRPSAEQLEFFETKVRPLLVEHCYQCHSAKSKKVQGGLRLDDRALILKGGDSGTAIVPGKPADSLLIKAVHWKTVEMPPRGKLKAGEVAVLEKWVEMGVPWPESPTPGTGITTSSYDWDKWREHWSFRPVKKPTIPTVGDTTWGRNDIDRFVLSRLMRSGLKPAPEADPRVLVRRIYFDLIGLPPTPEQVGKFLTAVKADRQDALCKLVDELLDSPHYGERWGRHWLDLAHYSDGFGGFNDSRQYPDAWRYRDWVVSALNADMPFDKFVRLQIAGDLLGTPEDAVATGFFALGPIYKDDGGDPDSIAQSEAETLSDRLDTLGRGLLGLTLACARCHDHKFDPIPTKDYYSLAGVFKNTAPHTTMVASPQDVEAYNRHQKAVADATKLANDLRNTIKKEKREATAEEKQKLATWDAELAELKRTAPPKPGAAHTLKDSGSADMKIAIRGDLRKPGEAAPRRFPRILAGDTPPLFDQGSGRKQLAEAVAARENPLTARVFVNRVWQHHFGEGLVRTPSNFGALGEKPTHPELLDWLTATFLESGQSVKALHRTIMLSATYQMGSNYDDAAYRKDGDNRLLWRVTPRRLDVEAWRDALLRVTGELDTTRGGPPIDRIETPRRTLYFKVSRNGDVFTTDEFLRRFDFPLMRATVDQRPSSTAPQQFLFLMNSPFMVARAKALAKRLATDAKTDRDRIERAYALLYQRPPTSEELDIGLGFLKDTATTSGLSAWDQYAQVLLATNEFMSVK